MSEFILNEAEVSGHEGSDHETIDVEEDLNDFKIENKFIDNDSVDEDVPFYHREKNGVGSGDEYESHYEIPNLECGAVDSNSNAIDNMSDDMRAIYGTDNYEWNHHKLPTDNIYEFPNGSHFMKRFHASLRMATKDNDSVNGFLPLFKNCVGLLEKNPYDFEFPSNPLIDEDDSHKILQSKDFFFFF